MDEELRRRARDAARGERGAQLALLRAAARAGAVPQERLELAACLMGAAEAALGVPATALPSASFTPGAPIPLHSVPRLDLGPGEYGLPHALPVRAELTCLDGPARAAALRLTTLFHDDRFPPLPEGEDLLQLPDVLREVALLGVRRLLLEFHGGTYLSSFAVAELITLAGRLQKRGGRLVLAAGEPVRLVVEMLALQELMTAYPDRDAALAALSFSRLPETRAPQGRLEELTRFGPEVCVRAALAIARAEEARAEEARAEEARSGEPREAALRAAQAWLDCPCAPHARLAREAATPLERRAPPGAPPDPDAWAFRAAATPARGTWPEPLEGAGPLDLDAACAALLPWVLGLE